MPGTLYLCATPIGNMEDISFRCIRTLKEVDLIAAEDTRNSIRILNYYEIKTPMTSYHEHNKIDKGKKLVEQLQKGDNIALITDAGTPGISDPGEELVRMCREAGITVTEVPGPAACVTALTLSGLPARRFVFEGFLPTDNQERQAVLDELRDETRTIVLYEAPHRLVKTLTALLEALGDRKISLCRELTKIHEDVWSTDLADALSFYEEQEPRGEFVLVIAGRDRAELAAGEQAAWADLTVQEHMDFYEAQGMEHRDAMRQVAKDRGVSRRDIYQELLKPPADN